MSQQPCTKQLYNAIQDTLILTRRFELVINCIILLYIIISIKRNRKHMQSVPMRLFMYCCICYFIGMLVVLTHNNAFTNNNSFYCDQNEATCKSPKLNDILTKMPAPTKILCGLQGFFNLYFYDLAYFFAVCVTYCIFCMHKGQVNFIKQKIIKSKLVILFLIFMLAIYLIPFIFAIIYKEKQIDFYYYAPTGFVYQYQGQQALQCTANLILYCGINYQENNMKYWGIANVYGLAFIMLVVHIWLICKNKQNKQGVLMKQDRTEQQQLYLLWNKISITVFGIQLFNFAKLILGLIFSEKNQDNPGLYHIAHVIIIFLNFIFDLYPCVLLYYYKKYEKSMKNCASRSTLLGYD